MANHAPDVLSFDVINDLQVRGADAVRARAQNWFSAYPGKIGYEVRDLKITAGADVAFCTYLYHVTGTLQDGGSRQHVGAGDGVPAEDGRDLADRPRAPVGAVRRAKPARRRWTCSRNLAGGELACGRGAFRMQYRQSFPHHRTAARYVQPITEELPYVCRSHRPGLPRDSLARPLDLGARRTDRAHRDAGRPGRSPCQGGARALPQAHHARQRTRTGAGTHHGGLTLCALCERQGGGPRPRPQPAAPAALRPLRPGALPAGRREHPGGLREVLRHPQVLLDARRPQPHARQDGHPRV